MGNWNSLTRGVGVRLMGGYPKLVLFTWFKFSMSQPVLPTTIAATFVLRFWRETSEGEERWRGRIEHIQSGETASFLQTEVMVSFIRRFCILSGADDQPTPKET